MRLNQQPCFIKVFRIFVIIAVIATTTISCGRKAMPSGVEQGLLSKKSHKSEIRKRERIAKRSAKETAKLERKAKKPSQTAKKKSLKAQKKAVARQINIQAPETKKRMKENQKYTKKNNPPNRTFWEKLMFWKKRF
ncbi:MAG: hypothetical protein WC951_09930 [Bacteroidales bacterium]|nr:hypothetical protein [Tenuifilaceae bacterium]